MPSDGMLVEGIADQVAHALMHSFPSITGGAGKYLFRRTIP
jgi:hypothetical protein